MLEGLKQALERMSNNRGSSIYAHYGIKTEDVDKWIKDMLIDMIDNNKKSDVIDKWFSKLDNEGRVKVLCFHTAYEKFNKIYE